uniref:Uncharacterized protein n=1 Tax=Chlamydomonas euryale TaxID=1486919 RepID=A0A7R9V8T6_9CHLO
MGADTGLLGAPEGEGAADVGKSHTRTSADSLAQRPAGGGDQPPGSNATHGHAPAAPVPCGGAGLEVIPESAPGSDACSPPAASAARAVHNKAAGGVCEHAAAAGAPGKAREAGDAGLSATAVDMTAAGAASPALPAAAGAPCTAEDQADAASQLEVDSTQQVLSELQANRGRAGKPLLPLSLRNGASHLYGTVKTPAAGRMTMAVQNTDAQAAPARVPAVGALHQSAAIASHGKRSRPMPDAVGSSKRAHVLSDTCADVLDGMARADAPVVVDAHGKIGNTDGPVNQNVDRITRQASTAPSSANAICNYVQEMHVFANAHNLVAGSGSDGRGWDSMELSQLLRAQTILSSMLNNCILAANRVNEQRRNG